FPNFKLESVYVGILPFVFALLGLCRPKKDRGWRLFWWAALLITFLLACGKYTPLYGLFFRLPLVNSIRNPNKFLQVTQWILGILCAGGVQVLWENSFPASARKKTALALIAISLLAGLASPLAVRPEALKDFSDTLWAGQAPGILWNRQIALLYLSLMAGAGGGLIFAGTLPRFRKGAGYGLLLLLCVDGLRLSQEYLKPANTRFLKENQLADFLKENLGAHRVSVLDPSGLYHFYLTHLFPAHQIAFADISVAPRLQQDYQRYFEAVGQDRFRIWQEFGVKYVLAPRRIYEQIQSRPGMERIFREVYRYDVVEHPLGGLRIAPGKPGGDAGHVVLEFLPHSDRFMLLPAWEEASTEDVLGAIQQREPPLQKARVQSEISAESLKVPPGEITGVLRTSHGFLLQVRVDTERAFLRLSDHFQPGLRARINEGPARPLLPTDLLFCGLLLDQGMHEVELLPPPLSAGVLAQWLGLLLTGITALHLGFSRISAATQRLHTSPGCQPRVSGPNKR
ncbi:MAG: hypothetical protein ACO3NW_10860, partial [Kiritimatiellia bacterium]